MIFNYYKKTYLLFNMPLDIAIYMHNTYKCKNNIRQKNNKIIDKNNKLTIYKPISKIFKNTIFDLYRDPYYYLFY
jgi:hypothetical protein